MKAISLWQPWATLVAVGAKKFETRHWATTYRGPIAIHAARKVSPEGCALVDELYAEHDEQFFKLVEARDECMSTKFHGGLALPVGCVVAIAKLVCVHRTETLPCNGLVDERERRFGNFAPGRYAWQLIDINPLDPPAPAKGAQGLFELPAGWLVEGQV